MKLKSLISKFLIVMIALVVGSALVAGSAQAVIEYKRGWNDAINNNHFNPVTGMPYTQAEATEFLRNGSEGLKLIIDGPKACVLQVVKGCHQTPPNNHFTVNGSRSKDTCKVKSLYVGSRSDHTPSC